jgi:hypothetical protein
MFSTFLATAQARFFRPNPTRPLRMTRPHCRLHQRARLCLELLEDRTTPSAHLFDALPSIDDLFDTDPALVENLTLAGHASGDLNAALTHADNLIATNNQSQTGPSAESEFQRPRDSPSSLGPFVDPQSLPISVSTPPSVVSGADPNGQSLLGAKRGPLTFGQTVVSLPEFPVTLAA